MFEHLSTCIQHANNVSSARKPASEYAKRVSNNCVQTKLKFGNDAKHASKKLEWDNIMKCGSHFETSPHHFSHALTQRSAGERGCMRA